MAKISKNLADDLAYSLVKPRRDALHNKRKQLHEKIKAHYISQLPKEVQDFYASPFSNYLRTNAGVKIMNEGPFRFKEVSCVVPAKDSDNYHVPLTITDEALLTEARDFFTWEKAEDTELTSLKKELYATILGLGTAKQVALHFPELKDKLSIPPTENTAIVNVSLLRDRIPLPPIPTE